MVWTFLCSKIALLLHKLLFGDIKLSDLEHRNKKLSAHDCTYHIKTRTRPQLYHIARTSPQST